MSVLTRAAILLLAVAAVSAGTVFIVIHYLISNPPMVDYSAMAAGGQVSVVLQEDPQNNNPSNPDWVSYYVQDPKTHGWVHTTLFSVPAGTRVNMTIKGYDGCTPLRNNFWSRVQGTAGGTVSIRQFRNTGRPAGPAKTVRLINSWSHCAVGHTFSIPALHIFVPVGSPPGGAELCSESPCTEGPFTLERFSFRTPPGSGVFRWQCFIPCGGGFLDGNGGPMSTIGYMAGNMQVTS